MSGDRAKFIIALHANRHGPARPDLDLVAAGIIVILVMLLVILFSVFGFRDKR